MILKFRRLFILWVFLLSLLLVPVVAMQFTSEVDWRPGDFGVFALMLIVLGILIEVSLRLGKGSWKRFFLVLFSVLIFLLFWAELAVGIFGTPLAGS